MTTVIPSTATELAATAAASVAVNLASGEPLTVGEPTRDAGVVESVPHALLAQFTGSATGEFVLVVDEELATALREATIGPLELAAALAPTVEAVSIALGSIVLGPLQQLETRLAVNRVLQHEDAVVLPLRGAEAVRAAVAIGVESTAAAAAMAEALPHSAWHPPSAPEILACLAMAMPIPAAVKRLITAFAAGSCFSANTVNKTAGIIPHDPAVGAATIRPMQALTSAIAKALIKTWFKVSPPRTCPLAKACCNL